MNAFATPIQHLQPESATWAAFVAHLERVEMTRFALGAERQPLPMVFYLAVVLDERVVGHLSLAIHPLVIPQAEPDGAATPFTLDDGTILRESYVESFAVEPENRRRGYGEQLQRAALDFSRTRSCYQMRSFSSLDKRENYLLKAKLGFAMHPMLHTSRNGKRYSGISFIKVLADG
jgi:GNAT superfamily N-acetyltransferase